MALSAPFSPRGASRFIRLAAGCLSIVLAVSLGAGTDTTAQIIVTPAPLEPTVCVGYTPRVEELVRGTGAVATAQSKVRIKVTRLPAAQTGPVVAMLPVAVRRQNPLLEAAPSEEMVYDFPLLRSIGVRMLGTTQGFLADVVIPFEGEPMRVGGRRRVSIECKDQRFELEVLEVFAGVPKSQRSVRTADSSACWGGVRARGAQFKGDSLVDAPSYRRLRDELIQLADANPQWAQPIDYGSSVRNCPLTLLRIALDGAARPLPHRPAVLISGAIHGNEYLGIEMTLAKRFLGNRNDMPGLNAYLSAGGVIYLVPVVNPDGFDARVRVNAARIDSYPGLHEFKEYNDLNRDFAIPLLHERRFTQRESSALASYIRGDLSDNHLRLEFSLDYHCCADGLITPWTYNNDLPDRPDLSDFNSIALWAGIDVGLQVKTARGISGEDAPGSTIDYYYATYRTRAVSIEGRRLTDRGGEQARLQAHVKFLDRIFGELSRGRLSSQ